MGQLKNVSPSDPVFMATPGQAVFSMICINCHGPNLDAHGRMADNLATMTGGNAIVANFRDGLFGPLDSPGLHRQEAFSTSTLPAGLGPSWTDVSVDDRASRYLAWMALGGTQAQIPLSILQIVGDTELLGVKRTLPPAAISANMLSAAKVICASLLVDSVTATPIPFTWSRGWFQPDPQRSEYLELSHLLIAANGDAELWMRLCAANNPPPVRSLTVDGKGSTSGKVVLRNSLIDPGAYGQKPVGDEGGHTQPTLAASNCLLGSSSGTPPACNLFPWCIPPDNQDAPTFAAAGLPLCSVVAGSSTCGDKCWSDDRIDQWAIRGAINAGLAVYLYVDALVKDLAQGKPPKPSYDQCDKLP
jgi:hypothetical protein